MGKKYHISTVTNAPGICRAEKGQCPYGKHYDTFGEAAAEIQLKFEREHEILPGDNGDNKLFDEAHWEEINELFDSIGSEDFVKNEEEGVTQEKDKWDELRRTFEEIQGRSGLNNDQEGKDEWKGLSQMFESIQSNKDIEGIELMYLIRSMGDTLQLREIIKGNLFYKDDWSTIGAALQNPALPRDIIDKILNNPDEHHIEAQKWLATNPSLTHDDLMNIVNNSKDMDLRMIALKNESLSQDFIKDFAANKSDKLTTLPWFNMTKSENISSRKLLVDFEVDLVIRGVDISGLELKSAKVNREYPDWKNAYE